MIALAVRQPWAFLLVNDLKDVENRSRRPPEKYVGARVLLHASAQPEFDRAAAFGLVCDRLGVKDRAAQLEWWHRLRRMGGTQTGGIVGEFTLAGYTRESSSPWAEAGMWHWLVKDARMLPFRPCRGQLGFFEVSHG